MKQINFLHDAPVLDWEDAIVTHHATERQREMCLTDEDLRDVIEEPTRAWISKRYNSWMFENRKIRVGLREHSTSPGKWALVTILWTDYRSMYHS